MDQYNGLQYVFVDDFVSLFDENYLIELVVNLVDLVKVVLLQLKFVIIIYSFLFYNVLYNEFDLKRQGKKEGCYLFEWLEDGSFNLNVKYGDVNKSFFYYLYLKKVLEEVIVSNVVE